jgi:hypothetical protein
MENRFNDSTKRAKLARRLPALPRAQENIALPRILIIEDEPDWRWGFATTSNTRAVK